jgi:hypothetical protein
MSTLRILIEQSGKSFFYQKYICPSQMVARTFFQFFYLKNISARFDDFAMISVLLVLLLTVEIKLLIDLK